MLKFLKTIAFLLAATSVSPLMAQEGVRLFRVPLQAQGQLVQDPGHLELSASALAFPDVVVGSASAGSVVLQNTGAQSVVLGAISSSGSASFHLDASGCSVTLAAGDFCAIGVSFAPQARGLHEGGVSILYDGANLAEISLSGRGLQGQVQAGVSGLNFGSVLIPSQAVSAQSVTLTNIGDGPVSSIALSLSAPFVLENACPFLAAGQACAVNVGFAPAAAGSFDDALRVSTPVGDLEVSVRGEAVAATTLAEVVSGSPADFGSVAQNSAAVSRTIVLRNGGTGPMSITGVTGLPSSVGITSNTCTSVTPNSTCSLTLTMGTTSATAFANLTLNTEGATTNASIQVSGSVSAVFASNQFSSATRQRTAYVCPDSGYCMSDLVSNIYAIRNNTGQTLTVQSGRLCGPNNLSSAASNFRRLYLPSNAQGTGTTASTLGSCTDTAVSISWPSGTFIHLVHEADYNVYGYTNWPRPQRFGVTGTETSLAGTGTYSSGSAQLVLSNGQRLTLTVSGLTIN